MNKLRGKVNEKSRSKKIRVSSEFFPPRPENKGGTKSNTVQIGATKATFMRFKRQILEMI